LRPLGHRHQPEPPLCGSAGKPLPDYVVARSPLMQAVFRDAALIAPSETRILITGESGTGKEVVADVIHAWSSRAAGPWSRSTAPPSRNAAGKRTVRARKGRVHRRARPAHWPF
jgi:DNA-binding NtrC family response regulator